MFTFLLLVNSLNQGAGKALPLSPCASPNSKANIKVNLIVPESNVT